jgi:dTDP-4-amino-4,6-dideoxygalactose transaminase
MNPDPNISEACRRRTTIPSHQMELGIRDLIEALIAWPAKSVLETLTDRLGNMIGERKIILVPSARCGLAQLLALLPQKEIVIPAYTCHVVCEAALVAGKRIIFADLAPGSVNATSRQFEPHARPGRILIPTHQFGIPTDIQEICRLARERDCLTIEDSAACLFGELSEKTLGTFGDVGLFSFEKSKRIPAFRGGVLVINNEGLFDESVLASKRFGPTQMKWPFKEFFHCLIVKTAINSWIYEHFTFPYLLKKPGFGKETPAPPDTVAEMLKTPAYTKEFHPFQAALVLNMLNRWNSIREKIFRLVTVYKEVLEHSSLVTYAPTNAREGSLLRFPFSSGSTTREEYFLRAAKAGIDVGFGFTRPCVPVNEYDHFPNAVRIARELMYLPLNSSLDPQRARALAEEIKLLDAR